jgi:hypothetical protein
MNRIDTTVLFDGVLYYSNPLNTFLTFLTHYFTRALPPGASKSLFCLPGKQACACMFSCALPFSHLVLFQAAISRGAFCWFACGAALALVNQP